MKKNIILAIGIFLITGLSVASCNLYNSYQDDQVEFVGGGRTSNYWNDNAGNYLTTTDFLGYDILINGENRYLNFNLTSGDLGYGFRDNNGNIEFKDSGGSWQSFSLGGGLIATQFTATSPLTIATTSSSVLYGITQADTDTDGYLSSTDWNTFNNKVTFPGFDTLLNDYAFTDNSTNWDTAYGWGNHASGGYLTSVSSDSTWTDHNSYPAGCSAGNYVQVIGDTLTCAADQDTTYVSSDFNHDNLTGFVANEHIDWTGASAGTIHATNYVDNNTTYTGGDYLTLNGTAFDVDPETVIYKSKIAFETPTADDDFFFDELNVATTFTSIYCKTLVGTVDLDITVAGTDINGTDITCTTTGVEDSTLGGDTAGAVGEEIKLEITSVASDPTFLIVELRGTYDD